MDKGCKAPYTHDFLGSNHKTEACAVLVTDIPTVDRWVHQAKTLETLVVISFVEISEATP